MFGRHIIRALACAFLLSSLALAGCTMLEKLDRQSDELLDEVNDPGSARSTSSRSSGQSTSGRIEISVVERKGMSMYPVNDARGNTVEIWGQTKSSSTTPGHDTTIEAKALAMAYSGKYRYITLQRSWRTATGRVSESTMMPDLIGVRHDGRVDAVEVQSKTDDKDALEARLEKGMRTLPEQHRGKYEVIDADPTMKGGVLSK